MKIIQVFLEFFIGKKKEGKKKVKKKYAPLLGVRTT